jgi:hypothetical protein
MRIGRHADCRFGDTLAAFMGTDNNAVSPIAEYQSEHNESGLLLFAKAEPEPTRGHWIVRHSKVICKYQDICKYQEKTVDYPGRLRHRF